MTDTQEIQNIPPLQVRSHAQDYDPHDRKIVDIDTKISPIILDYSSSKGGVETLNKLDSNLSCGRMHTYGVL